MSQPSSNARSRESPEVVVSRKGNHSVRPPTILQTLSQRQEDDYKESKPFQKRYGVGQSSNAKGSQPKLKPITRQSMGETHATKQTTNQNPVTDTKVSTKQNFNSRLQNNIIKDEQ
jgi:hypothetical protein